MSHLSDLSLHTRNDALLRSRSAPPFCVQEHTMLVLLSSCLFSPRAPTAKSPLTRLPVKGSEVTRVYSVSDMRVVLGITRRRVLKIFPALLDVTRIVTQMERASTAVRVPKIYQHGWADSVLDLGEGFDINQFYPEAQRTIQDIREITARTYSFIIMEELKGTPLDTLLPNCPGLLEAFRPKIKVCIDRLAAVGIAHNDMLPRNILVDTDHKEIVAVVDWDCAGSVIRSREYHRRIHNNHLVNHEWDALFLRHSFDKDDALLMPPPCYPFHAIQLPHKDEF
ncbi:hypothetical protein K435DRAFT_857784 [Dendrothele bispora CBS 962.96]|uniref:Aminoglycoside phosphotransferase domain-containing protein n=1 Tax=Dendrothele bispora (strain CBS 962.96) TaxID=1314807 RepID=A0A4S8M5D1_DENBC|nr:hypothetical protein K435DRAFT_857784 [Dendrothele bispora CBS 962.96]